MQHQQLVTANRPHKLRYKKLFAIFTYNRTSLIRTPKGQSEVSVLERCPYKRGHYDDVTFMTPLTVLRECSVAKTRITLVFKLNLKLLIHSTKILSFSSIEHCTSQLYTNYCFKTKRGTAQCCM